jgi:hypothetical protein
LSTPEIEIVVADDAIEQLAERAAPGALVFDLPGPGRARDRNGGGVIARGRKRTSAMPPRAQ